MMRNKPVLLGLASRSLLSRVSAAPQLYPTCHLGTSPVIVHMRPALLYNNISNRLVQPSRSVYGTNGHATNTRSYSTFASLSSWRHASLTRHCHPSFPINSSNGHLNARAVSWATKFNFLSSPPSCNESDPHEEAAKAAILEAIKGRQQTDLMLRCESTLFFSRQVGSFLFPRRYCP
jgi:hypothetical protein